MSEVRGGFGGWKGKPLKERDDVIRDNPIDQYLLGRGVKLDGAGVERSCRCPFHEDKVASFSVNVEKGLWVCHAGCGGGSVIDLIAKFEGTNPRAILKRLAGSPEGWKPLPPTLPAPPSVEVSSAMQEAARPKLVKTYDYRNARGDLVYQVCRLEPKGFRQRRPVDGKWVWNMDRVERVLYQLPKVLKTQQPVVCVEGEKDADTITVLGLVGTTNVGGAGKWLDAYSEVLRGKEVVLCGDNDKAGREHMDKVLESLAGKAKLVRMVRVPEPHKDVTEWLDAVSLDLETRFNAFKRQMDEAAIFDRGLNTPIRSMIELEQEFRISVSRSETHSLDLSRWIPSFGGVVRPLVGGEVVTFLGGTGVGKSAVAQNLAIHAAPLKTLVFQQELPGSLTFERFVAISTRIPQRTIYHEYKSGQSVDWMTSGALSHIYTCSRTRLTVEAIKELVVKSQLKIGEPPALVVVDYIQLMGGDGDRYGRVSDAAEGLKVLAKETDSIVVVISQISRKYDDSSREVRITDGKESGSIENSSGLVIGVWLDAKDESLMRMKVLKNTKGKSGIKVECNFDGDTLLITERAAVVDEAVPEVGKPYRDD